MCMYFEFMNAQAVPVQIQHQPVKFSGAPMGSTAGEPLKQQQQMNKKTSGKAIASLVCAIIGLFVAGVVFGPVAICLGVAAKNEIKENPDQVEGECMANSGLIIGIIGFVLSIIVIIWMASSSTY